MTQIRGFCSCSYTHILYKVNIQKARRAMYSLMPAGLHGENGLDPQTAVHVFQIYVLPVLLYGLEVAVPSKSNLDTLEKFLRTSLKQILSLPTSTASPVVHILTGILPVEAMVHKRILALFGSICRLNEDSVEKRLCRRQISVKSYSSHSWFIIVKELKAVVAGAAGPASAGPLFWPTMVSAVPRFSIAAAVLTCL